MADIIYENLSREEVDFLVTNDCGGTNFDVADLIFDPACFKHDVLYWVGVTEEDRKNTDWIFYVDMKNLLAELPWYKRWKFVFIKWYLPPVPLASIPRIYYWSVRIGGKIGFNFKKKRSYEDLVYAMTLANHESELPEGWDD